MIPYERMLKRLRYHWQLGRGTFRSPEPEFSHLRDWLKPGDWAIDVGANVGHYTIAMARVVGPQGHVLAFEPIPETFSLLAANIESAHLTNVTLINAAVADVGGTVGMKVPQRDKGARNYYRAFITEIEPEYRVCMLRLDALDLRQSIALIKVDTEGYDDLAIGGMLALIECNHPRLIIESPSTATLNTLCACGYHQQRLASSPNLVLTYRCGSATVPPDQ